MFPRDSALGKYANLYICKTQPYSIIRCGSTQIEHYYDFCHSCIACPQKQAKTIKYYITRSQIVTILLGKIVKTSNNNVPLLIINFTIIFFNSYKSFINFWIFFLVVSWIVMLEAGAVMWCMHSSVNSLRLFAYINRKCNIY